MADTMIAPDVRIAGTVQRYLTGAETLRLTVYNSAANVRVSLSGRRFPYGGTAISEFAAPLVPTTNRLATVLDFTPGEGWLLGLAVRVVAGAPLEGQTYVVVEIGNGQAGTFQPFDTLIADTVTAAHRVAWPGSPIKGPIDGPGALRSITGSTPAAGAEISETVPTGARWEVLTFGAQFVSAVAVANRLPGVLLDDGTNTLWRSSTRVFQTASLTEFYFWGAGAPATVAADNNIQSGVLPVGMRLASGSRLRTSTLAIQGADQYSAVQYLVREWLEGA